MQQKHSDCEKIVEIEKPSERIRESLGAIVLIAALIFKTIFHKKDFDIVFDACGKATIYHL